MKRSLIPDLVKNRKITPDIILEYCRSAAHSTVSNSQIHNIKFHLRSRSVFPCSPSASICSTFGLDRDDVINQYITTLLLLQEDEDGAGDAVVGQEEMQPVCHADALERVLQIIPMLQNTSELTSSLCAAMLKVCAWGGRGRTSDQFVLNMRDQCFSVSAFFTRLKFLITSDR